MTQEISYKYYLVNCYFALKWSSINDPKNSCHRNKDQLLKISKRFGSDKNYYLTDFLLSNLLLVLVFGYCILSQV